LCSQYENFNINENKTIDNMSTHFTMITNGLSFIGEFNDNDQKVRRVIRLFHSLEKSSLQLERAE